MTTYVDDTFTRTGALDFSSPDVGPGGTTWHIFYTSHEDWETNGTQAYCYEAWDAAGQGFCTIDAGVANCTIKLVYDYAKQNQFVWRFVDDSGFNIGVLGAGGQAWWSVTGGSWTQVGSTISTGIASSGIRETALVLSGTTWTLYCDGVQITSATGQTNQQTATKHGLRCDPAADFLTAGSGTAYTDRFTVDDSVPTPPSSGATGLAPRGMRV